ncbi:MAG: hypothetical protein ACKOKA_03805 [Acidimicrobiaceae bacterium]
MLFEPPELFDGNVAGGAWLTGAVGGTVLGGTVVGMEVAKR